MTSLGSNLQEIYSACQGKETESAQLVPNLTATRIYHAGCGWGRAWKWFYRIIEYVFGKDLHTKRLQHVMQKTRQIFSDTLPRIQEHIETYHSYLEKRLGEENIAEQDVHTCRKRISQWNRSIAPFIQFSTEKPTPSLQKLFQDFYPEALEEGCIPFSSEIKQQTLHEAQQLIDLEGYLHGPLPLGLIKRLALQQELTAPEQRELLHWIDTLNQNKERIPSGLFIKCLGTLADRAGQGVRLIDLEMQLLQNNLEILHQPDKEHVRWRDSLKARDSLFYGEEEIILGDPIPRKESGLDANILFAIKGDPDHVAAIGINCAYWPIKEKISQDHQWGIPMPDIRRIAPDGTFAVIEKLEPALPANQWITPPHSPLNPKDKEILLPIANQIRWWADQSLCPESFSLSHLMFDQSGSLKYTRAMTPQPFDFLLLEDLIKEIAQTNLSVYLYLMRESNLANHIMINFFQKIVSQALKGKPLEAKRLAACRKITDPKAIERGTALYKEILALKNRLTKEIASQYTVTDSDRLSKEINEQIEEWFRDTKSASLFWASSEPAISGNLKKRYALRTRLAAERTEVSEKDSTQDGQRSMPPSQTIATV
jgi:hypothetical protein